MLKNLEKKANKDLKELKAKGYVILENSYTEEVINKTEFSTGEIFMFFNFTGNIKDYSVGYFMLNGIPYSIFSQGISHAESEVIFSFISPVTKRVVPNSKTAKKAYSINYNFGEVETTEITKIDKNQNPIIVEVPKEIAEENVEVSDQRTFNVDKITPSVLTEAKQKFTTTNLPGYLKNLQNFIPILAIIIVCYIAVTFLALMTKMFIGDKPNFTTPDETAQYPLKMLRLYGTPEIIYKLKNNQGSIFIALHSRWGYLLSFAGIIFLAITFLVMLFAKIFESSMLFQNYPLIASSVFGLGKIIAPFGLFLFLIGFVVKIFVDRDIYVYDSDGNLVYIVSKAKFSLFEKRFVAYDKNENILFYFRRNKFLALRSWKISDDGNNPVMHIKETNIFKSLARKLLGHLFGLLRASYTIETEKGKKGSIKPASSMFHKFDVDMPENIKGLYPQEVMLIALAVNVFDTDKFHPSCN